MEEIAKVIREYFLQDSGKWEVDEHGWLWIYDANYGFDPMELVRFLMEKKNG